MKEQSAAALLNLLPDSVGAFSGTEYPLPVKTAILGGKSLDLSALRRELSDKTSGDIKDLLSPLLLGAEAYESVQPDRAKYFIPDRKVQNYVFMGSKWRAGWALILGGRENGELIQGLKEREFMVFTDEPGIADTWYIGARETSPIYFLQLMVRYGLVWGKIRPGDDHQLGHYLETDMPGVLILREGLSPLKYVLALGLMKLGAPALVPSSFPFPYGNRVVADSQEEIFARINGFQNLRRKYYKGEVIALPEYANPAHANQDFKAASTLGGTGSSFFCLSPAKCGLSGSMGNGTAGVSDEKDIGILVEIDEPAFTDDIASVVEKDALRSLNFLEGMRAVHSEGVLTLEFSAGTELNPDKIISVLRQGIRLQYPGIRNITVQLIRDRAILQGLAPAARAYKEKRKAFIDGMNESNTEEFCVCTECRPFSLVHTCILTPERIPMCAARTYFTVKAGHYFGSDVTPYQRRSESALPLRFAFNKGKTIDPLRGEYEGANRVYADMTRGQLSRVYLHSLKEVPHTSCGCFQNLAFFLKGTDRIGIMKRASNAVTPDGRTWEMLANEAGGKQTPGILGVSFQYVMSSDFLRGDGGMAHVAWVDSELFSKIKSRFAAGQKVATEKEASNLEALERFLAA